MLGNKVTPPPGRALIPPQAPQSAEWRATDVVPSGPGTSAALRLGAVQAGRFCMSVAFRFLLIIALLLGGGFAALYARLVYSPITMSMLVPPIEKAVNRALAGFRFDIGDAVLRRSDSG